MVDFESILICDSSEKRRLANVRKKIETILYKIQVCLYTVPYLIGHKIAF